MPKLSSLSIDKFLEKLASSEPVPGGGSAAALVLAEACALGEMVARLNEKRARKQGIKNPPSQKNIAPLSKARRQLLALLEEDAKIFSKLSTFKKEDRLKLSYEKTLKKAASIPHRMCSIANEAIKITSSEKPRTSAWLTSDLLESAVLFESGFKAARLNVEINLAWMKDKSFIGKTTHHLNQTAKSIRRSSKIVLGK